MTACLLFVFFWLVICWSYGLFGWFVLSTTCSCTEPQRRRPSPGGQLPPASSWREIEPLWNQRISKQFTPTGCCFGLATQQLSSQAQSWNGDTSGTPGHSHFLILAQIPNSKPKHHNLTSPLCLEGTQAQPQWSPLAAPQKAQPRPWQLSSGHCWAAAGHIWAPSTSSAAAAAPADRDRTGSLPQRHDTHIHLAIPPPSMQLHVSRQILLFDYISPFFIYIFIIAACMWVLLIVCSVFLFRLFLFSLWMFFALISPVSGCWSNSGGSLCFSVGLGMVNTHYPHTIPEYVGALWNSTKISFSKECEVSRWF